MSPDSIANTTSWARSRACSFTMARDTWVRTVSGLTTSTSAISWLDRQGHPRDDLAFALYLVLTPLLAGWLVTRREVA